MRQLARSLSVVALAGMVLLASTAAAQPLGALAIYVADTGNDRIVRIQDMSQSGWVALGSRGEGRNQFNRPLGVAADAGGRIYIADSFNARIVRIDEMTGTGWKSLGWRGVPPLVRGGPFTAPTTIAVDAGGSVFITDIGFIMRLNPGWTDWRTLAFGVLIGRAPEDASPRGIAIDSSGRIFFTDASRHRIIRMDNITGAGWISFGSEGSEANQFHDPKGIAVDPAGHIYVADAANNRIVRINDMTGAGWTTLGGPRAAGEGQFDRPNGIAVDGAGRIYVADTGNHRIVRMDDITGAGWVTFGKGGRGVHEFAVPTGISVAPPR